MKKLITFLALALVLSTNAQTTFQKAYGTAGGDEQGGAFIKTMDGGYIMAGSTSTGSAGQYDVYVVKTDSNGVLQWTKTYGGTKLDVGSYIAPTADSGYIITGYTSEDTLTSYKVLLLKITKNGTYQWSKTYGLNYDFGRCVQQTADKGYIVTGVTGSNSVYDHIYVFKTDSMGNLQWNKKIMGGGDNSYGAAIKQTRDGGYILLGNIAYNAASKNIMYLAKISAVDTFVWEKYFFATSGQSYAMNFEQTKDKGFIIAGNTGTGACLLKTDSTGTALWTQSYGWTGNEDELGTTVKEIKEGGYVMAGHYKLGATNTWLLKTDSLGLLKWGKTYGQNSNLVYSLMQNKDGGYTMGGYTGDFGSGGDDLHLTKTDSLGNSNCNETVIQPTVSSFTFMGFGGNSKDTLGKGHAIIFQESSLGVESILCYETMGIKKIIQEELISIYPNPNNGNFTVETNATTKQLMQIYDVNGRVVIAQSINNKVTIDASTLPSGVYNVSIISNNGVVNNRIVITH